MPDMPATGTAGMRARTKTPASPTPNDCTDRNVTNYICIDLGKKRTGVAVYHDDSGLVSPLTVLHGMSRTALIDELCRLAGEHDADFVLGMPTRLEGQPPGRWHKSVLAFSHTLRRACGRPVHLQDEALSSAEARERALQAGRPRGTPIDDIAAAVILGDFMARIGRGEIVIEESGK